MCSQITSAKLTTWKILLFQHQLLKKPKGLLNTFSAKWRINKLKRRSLSMKIKMVIGMLQNKRNQENSRVLFSKNSLQRQLSTILLNSLIVKIGMLRWVFLIKGVIFSMVLQGQVKVPLLKLLLAKSNFQFALWIALTTSMISNSIVC